jgi:hypothetical protein
MGLLSSSSSSWAVGVLFNGEKLVWVKKLKSTTKSYVTRNYDQVWYNAMASLELFYCEHPRLFKRMTMMMIISPFGQLGL